MEKRLSVSRERASSGGVSGSGQLFKVKNAETFFLAGEFGES